MHHRIFSTILACLVCAQMSAAVVERAEVKPYNGRTALFINGEPVVPMIYALTDRPSGKWSFETAPGFNIGQFAKAGVKLFQMDIWFYEMLDEDGNLDITLARKQVAGVLDKCPEATVMFRLHVNPPQSWLQAHPEEWTRYADAEVLEEPYRPSHQVYEWAELTNVPRASFASKVWLSWAEKVLKEFCVKMAASPEGQHIMGIQIANGLNGENHQWAFVKHDPDVSAPMEAFFRDWLKEKYGSEKALKKAWNDPSATFSNATLPGMERYETSDGIFRNPQKEMRIADYYESMHKSVTASILALARVVRESWPRPVAVGAFYGYYLSMFGRQAAGGHLCEQDILTSPDIDFLCAPQAYNKNSRIPGGPALSRGMIESMQRHGKLWLDEMDQPTHHGYVYLGGLQKYPLEESVQIMRKFVLEPFVRGAGMWFYDFGPVMSSGWWDDPAYQKEVTDIRKIEEKYFHQEQDSPADVLLVFDTRVFFHTAIREEDDPITDIAAVNIVPIEIFKSGAAVATCYLSDLQLMPLEKYKAVVFMNCFLMTEQERKWIRENVARDGRTLVWLTAPGYNNGSKLDENNISKLTGINIRKVTPASEPVSSDKPLFYVSDKNCSVISEESGTVLAAVKSTGHGSDCFYAVAPKSSFVWTDILCKAGCHIYSDSGDALIAGSGLLLIHTKDGGDRKVTLLDGTSVNLKLNPLQTVLLDARSGEVLLK